MFSIKLWLVVMLILQWRIKVYGDININVESLITSSINTVNKPCEDFYSYACGSYAKYHSSDSYQDVISYLDVEYNKQILSLCETYYQHDRQALEHKQSFVQKAFVYLQACRAEIKRNLTRYFEEIKPGPQLNWPILEELTIEVDDTYHWPYDREFDIWALLGKLQSYGLNNVIINQEILVNKQEEMSIMLEPLIKENGSTLPDLKLLHVLLLRLGIKNPAKIVNNLRKTNKILLNNLENYVLTNEKNLEMTFGDLEILYPRLNLSVYLNELLGTKLSADTFILLRKPSYFQHLNHNMEILFEKQHLCNYLMMKFLFFLTMDSVKDFSDITCVKDLRNKFDLAVNYLYHHHHMPAKQHKYIKSDIMEMFSNLTKVLGKYFETNYLNLSSSHINLLLEKLAQVRLNIGNLPENVNLEKIEEFYARVPPMDANNYFKNQLLMLKHRFATTSHYAGNQTHFIVADNKVGSSTGAFYVNQQNMIILPYASLRPPLYHIEYADLNKYSLLGFILAHELAHAFDTNGLNFNAQGQYSIDETDVLTNKNYQSSVKCLQNQLLTDSIDERIADIVGLQIVYKILVLKLSNSKTDLSHEIWKKKFYLTVAQIFCNKKNTKYVDHDSDVERLNQIVINAKDFAQAFNCTEGSAMNPKEKCRLY